MSIPEITGSALDGLLATGSTDRRLRWFVGETAQYVADHEWARLGEIVLRVDQTRKI